jgi:hypothetical protein
MRLGFEGLYAKSIMYGRLAHAIEKAKDSILGSTYAWYTAGWHIRSKVIKSDRDSRIHKLLRGVIVGYLALITSSFLYEEPK